MTNTGREPIRIDDIDIEHDASGVGAAWRPATDATCPADIRQEIAAEIIDGQRTTCADYVASNGLHYRW